MFKVKKENVLEKRERIVHIEISKSVYVKNKWNIKWNIRIGDIIGSTSFSNMGIKEILEEIESEMKILK